MLNAMGRYAIAAAISITLGTPWAQNQTNVTVQDGKSAPPRDSVKVVPEGSAVVPNSSGGNTIIDDKSYTPPDTVSEVGAIPKSQTETLQNRREAKRFATAGFGPAGFGNVAERMPAYDFYAGRFWEVNK